MTANKAHAAFLKRFDAWLDNLPDQCVLPDEVRAWIKAERANPEHAQQLLDFAVDHVSGYLIELAGARLRSRRSTARRRALMIDRADRLEAVSEGRSPFNVFHVVAVTDKGQQVQKRVADMTGADHRFVAGRYRDDSKRKSLLAHFHLAVARKVKNRTTAEVLTVDAYDALFRSTVGADQPTGVDDQAA